jgi:FdhE protein
VLVVDAGKRLLVCSLCAYEWGFPDGICPGCRAEDLEVLRHRSMPHVRAEGCRACRRYLKVVDLRREPKAVGVVDELAAVKVAQLAAAKGHAKFQTNLAGQ